jgi:hypothetical protein
VNNCAFPSASLQTVLQSAPLSCNDITTTPSHTALVFTHNSHCLPLSALAHRSPIGNYLHFIFMMVSGPGMIFTSLCAMALPSAWGLALFVAKAAVIVGSLWLLPEGDGVMLFVGRMDVCLQGTCCIAVQIPHHTVSAAQCRLP